VAEARGVGHRPVSSQDPLQVLLAEQALGVDLADVLYAQHGLVLRRR
jgi:hypothetical protein